MRNQIQHDSPIYFDDVEKFYQRVENLFIDILKYVFSIDYENMDIEDFIEEDTIKKQIISAKTNWSINKRKLAIAQLRNAFDNAKYKYLHSLFKRNYMNLDVLMLRQKIDFEIRFPIKSNIEALIFSSVGIDVIKYATYCEIVDFLPEPYHIDYRGGPVMHEDEEFTDKQNTFVRNFVLDAVSKMQEKKMIDELGRLHQKPRETRMYRNRNHDHIELNGVFFELNERSYIYAGLVSFEMIHGFEVNDLEAINHIKSLRAGYPAGPNKMINAIYYYIISNEPACWRVCVAIQEEPPHASNSDI